MPETFAVSEKLSELTLEDLRFFARIYEELSLSSAALRCGISLSRASRILKKLRETFADRLFLRSMPELIATERATQLYPKVIDLVNRASQLGQTEIFDPATLTRTFRIGAVDNAIFAVMTDVIEAFFRLAPHARLEITQLTPDLTKKLEKGTLDCAIFPSSRELPPGIRELRLYQVRYAVCVRSGHPLETLWREKGSIGLDDLRCWRKIRISNETSTDPLLYSLDEKNFLGESFLDCAVTVPFFLSVPSILQVTDFMAILPLQTAIRMQKKLAAPSIAVIPVMMPSSRSEQDPKSFYTRLIWHERMDGVPAMEWLRGLFALYARFDLSDHPIRRSDAFKG